MNISKHQFTFGICLMNKKELLKVIENIPEKEIREGSIRIESDGIAYEDAYQRFRIHFELKINDNEE